MVGRLVKCVTRPGTFLAAWLIGTGTRTHTVEAKGLGVSYILSH